MNQSYCKDTLTNCSKRSKKIKHVEVSWFIESPICQSSYPNHLLSKVNPTKNIYLINIYIGCYNVNCVDSFFHQHNYCVKDIFNCQEQNLFNKMYLICNFQNHYKSLIAYQKYSICRTDPNDWLD